VSRLAIRLELESALAEPLSDALLEAGADSVDLDGDGRSIRLTALAPRDADAAALVARAAAATGIALPAYRAERIEDEDWVRRSQAQFGPIGISGGLWIVPSWHEAPEAAALVVRLDPGLAFGTGSHSSTRLVLEWLVRRLRRGERVLDYGCGSGILAIAAARLGAGEVAAVDTDPLAVETAAGNARANGVALTVMAPGALPAGPYDLIVANILAAPLMALEPEFAARTRRGGRIALSGLLEAQAEALVAAYARDFAIERGASDGDWVLLEGVRR